MEDESADVDVMAGQRGVAHAEGVPLFPLSS